MESILFIICVLVIIASSIISIIAIALHLLGRENISSRYCKWIRETHSFNKIYKTGCGHLWDCSNEDVDAYNFCPCCGKHIKVSLPPYNRTTNEN